MLHTENRKSSKKSIRSLTWGLLFALLPAACGMNEQHGNRNLTMEAFSDMKAPAFVFDVQAIGRQTEKLAEADADNTEADRQTKALFRKAGHALHWVDRTGVTPQADTLLNHLHTVGSEGLSERAFLVADIERDLRLMQNLDFDSRNDGINSVAARLEYRLTKACLRYCYGQRFGFVSPHKVFNTLEVEKEDTLRHITRYRGLFDIDIDRPTSHYAADVLRKVAADSLPVYLREIQPQDESYLKLKSMLPTASTEEQRKRIIVNMERSRWRRHQPMEKLGKRIVVNIPAYHLYAYADDSLLDMRVVCGSRSTKTPLLSSRVEWMEVNPQWVIPKSIIENEVAQHAGDSAYFARHRYAIVDKETRQEQNVRRVSRQQLLSGKYRVAQKGGAGNSLGRIVFRFKNNFSVFLHDTSTPGAFQRDQRSLSHGCVRVARPFDLANFVLEQPDEWLLDRIRIAMGSAPQTERGQQWVKAHPETEDHDKLIGYVGVKPAIPLYIIYNTLWPDADGTWQTWPDVYGYDDVMWQHMQPYLQ